MSRDHRKRQIDNGSVNRSRDRRRPPDQERIRRPAGTKAAHLENTGDNNSNASSFRQKQPSLQAQRASEARRLRRQRIWPLGDRAGGDRLPPNPTPGALQDDAPERCRGEAETAPARSLRPIHPGAVHRHQRGAGAATRCRTIRFRIYGRTERPAP